MKNFVMKWDKFRFPDENDDEEDDDDSIEEEDSYSEKEVGPNFQIARILTGGTENPFVQLKTFNFWTAHTNFRLNRELITLVSDVDGVETVDVISRYRFHISVGHTFDENQVKKAVYATLYEALNTNEQKQ